MFGSDGKVIWESESTTSSVNNSPNVSQKSKVDLVGFCAITGLNDTIPKLAKAIMRIDLKFAILLNVWEVSNWTDFDSEITRIYTRKLWECCVRFSHFSKSYFPFLSYSTLITEERMPQLFSSEACTFSVTTKSTRSKILFSIFSLCYSSVSHLKFIDRKILPSRHFLFRKKLNLKFLPMIAKTFWRRQIDASFFSRRIKLFLQQLRSKIYQSQRIV